MTSEINETLTPYNKPWIVQRADPHVYRHKDGNYYFTATVPAYDKIILRKSQTLLGLKEAEEITLWHKHPSGPMSHHIWAPEIHFLGGRWYIYFAAGEADDIWKIRPYVLECSEKNPMTDRWTEVGKMRRAEEDPFSFDAFSLDATVFENRGDYYYVWAEKVGVGKQISNVYIAKMASPTKLATVQVLLTTPDYDWERVGFWVNEGPAVIKHSGKIFLTYSASETGECYCMGMLSIDENEDILDPRAWKKERYPIVKSDADKRLFGPGHNSFTQSEDGRDVMIYHVRTYREISGDPLNDPNRHAKLMEVKWNQNGWPVFSFENEMAVDL